MTGLGTTRNLSVGPEHAGRPLLEFLAEEFDLSKRKAKSMLDRRNVFVNGRLIWMAQHSLRRDDRITVVMSDPACAKAAGQVIQSCVSSGTGQPGRSAQRGQALLFRDSHYVIVNKRPGIVSCGPHSLELELQEELKQPRLCAVHRLDRDTSGCLMFAFNKEAFEKMVSLFRQRKIDKRYHAIVEGMMEGRRRTIDRPISGEESVTHIEVLGSNRAASHLLARIETGRTHQIRRHLVAIGYRILGDRTYGVGKAVGAEYRGVARQMLHASSIGFIHPVTGVKVSVTAPLAPDFLQCLRHFSLK